MELFTLFWKEVKVDISFLWQNRALILLGALLISLLMFAGWFGGRI